MAPQTLLDYVLTQLDRAGVTQGVLTHKDGGTVFLTHPATTQNDANVYRPLLCAVLQGAKEVGTSTRTLTVRAGQSLIVSNALPVVSRITEATPKLPYVALVVPLIWISFAPWLRPCRSHPPTVYQIRFRFASHPPMTTCKTPCCDTFARAKPKRRDTCWRQLRCGKSMPAC